VSDRVRASLVVPDDVWAAVETHVDYVKAETLANQLMRVDQLTNGHKLALPDERHLHIGVVQDT
jgi:hypothetical protein